MMVCFVGYFNFEGIYTKPQDAALCIVPKSERLTGFKEWKKKVDMCHVCFVSFIVFSRERSFSH